MGARVRLAQKPAVEAVASHRSVADWSLVAAVWRLALAEALAAWRQGLAGEAWEVKLILKVEVGQAKVSLWKEALSTGSAAEMVVPLRASEAQHLEVVVVVVAWQRRDLAVVASAALQVRVEASVPPSSPAPVPEVIRAAQTWSARIRQRARLLLPARVGVAPRSRRPALAWAREAAEAQPSRIQPAPTRVLVPAEAGPFRAFPEN